MKNYLCIGILLLIPWVGCNNASPKDNKIEVASPTNNKVEVATSMPVQVTTSAPVTATVEVTPKVADSIRLGSTESDMDSKSSQEQKAGGDINNLSLVFSGQGSGGMILLTLVLILFSVLVVLVIWFRLQASGYKKVAHSCMKGLETTGHRSSAKLETKWQATSLGVGKLLRKEVNNLYPKKGV